MIAHVRGQDERQTELRAAQRGARELLGAGRHDVVELGRDVLGLARVVVARIVEGDVHDEAVYWAQVQLLNSLECDFDWLALGPLRPSGSSGRPVSRTPSLHGFS